MAQWSLGLLTSSQMRNRAKKAYHVQKQLLQGGHQAVPHMKMTEGFLWDAAAEILEQGHGAARSLPARRLAHNLNLLCSQLVSTKNQGETLSKEIEEGMKQADLLLAQSQLVLNVASKLCKKGLG